MVLLHGQPGAGAEWHRVVDALGESFDAVAPDRPGYGHNSLPAGGVVANVDWLEAGICWSFRRDLSSRFGPPAFMAATAADGAQSLDEVTALALTGPSE